jgi:hypothetical protein
MKTPFLITLLLFCFSLQLFAQQNSLIGTWQKISGDTLQSTKIITPTHWAVFTERLKGDGKEFVRAIAGTYTTTGDKYVEKITIGSVEGGEQAKTDYTYKVAGTTFHQKGNLTIGDTTMKIDEKWQKVNLPNQKNPAIGSWNQLTSTGVAPNGEKWSHDNSTHKRFVIITPTHWMVLSTKENKFENTRGGTYAMQGDKMMLKFQMLSYPDDKAQVEITQRMESGKLHWSGVVKQSDGKTMTFEDDYEKVNTKTIKTASTK